MKGGGGQREEGKGKGRTGDGDGKGKKTEVMGHGRVQCLSFPSQQTKVRGGEREVGRGKQRFLEQRGRSFQPPNRFLVHRRVATAFVVCSGYPGSSLMRLDCLRALRQLDSAVQDPEANSMNDSWDVERRPNRGRA